MQRRSDYHFQRNKFFGGYINSHVCSFSWSHAVQKFCCIFGKHFVNELDNCDICEENIWQNKMGGGCFFLPSVCPTRLTIVSQNLFVFEYLRSMNILRLKKKRGLLKDALVTLIHTYGHLTIYPSHALFLGQ